MCDVVESCLSKPSKNQEGPFLDPALLRRSRLTAEVQMEADLLQEEPSRSPGAPDLEPEGLVALETRTFKNRWWIITGASSRLQLEP